MAKNDYDRVWVVKSAGEYLFFPGKTPPKQTECYFGVDWRRNGRRATFSACTHQINKVFPAFRNIPKNTPTPVKFNASLLSAGLTP